MVPVLVPGTIIIPAVTIPAAGTTGTIPAVRSTSCCTGTLVAAGYFRYMKSIFCFFGWCWLVGARIQHNKEEGGGVVRRLHGLRMSTVVHVCVNKA